jgi:ubiquinone/menaquinone biosynthesis C-methylase UbiE
MTLAEYVAGQLGNPSGLLGRLVLPRLWNRRNAALNDLTFDRLDLQPQDQVLEVGCGGGYLLHRIAGAVTHGLAAGIDASPQIVAFCQRRFRSLVRSGRLQVVCASAEDIPYPSNCFSKACTVNTLFYLTDAPQAISELWRVLADGGKAAICFTDRRFLEGRSFAAHGLNLCEAAEVRDMMDVAGFQDIRLTRGSDRWREFIILVGSR